MMNTNMYLNNSGLSYQPIKGYPIEPEIAVYAPFAPATTIGRPVVGCKLDPITVGKLKQEGYSDGLIAAMAQLKMDFAKQIWILDNSGSMSVNDGNLLVGDSRFVRCSRWNELQSCVEAHIKLSGQLRFPTSFRLLNNFRGDPDQFSVCEFPHGNVRHDVETCLGIVSKNQPEGGTPLAHHVRVIRKDVEAMIPSLQTSSKKVSIVICTDGLPTDATGQQFIAELRKLPAQYVSLVIRLCTDEAEIVQYYNELDMELAIAVDVIDDFRDEALEAVAVNPWLNYSLPLHRIREMGCNNRVLDFLDERPLSKREQKEVCSLLFGKDKMISCPDPCIDWPGFLSHIDRVQTNGKRQWDPILGELKPMVDFQNASSKLRKGRRLKRKLTPPSTRFGCFGC